MKDQILVVGGYGAVGSIISAELAKQYPHKVIVGGRDIEKALKLSAALQDTVTPKQFDVHQYKAYTGVLDAVRLVVMCIDQDNTYFIAWCLEAGIDYIDITANQQLITQIEQLDALAQERQRTLILSVGLAPGITNLLAQHSLQKTDAPQEIDILILLGLGEQHGTAAYQWTMDNLNTRYRLNGVGGTVMVDSFTDPLKARVLGARTFYRFNFSDQHTLAKTLPVAAVNTRMAFDSRYFTRLVAFMRRLGMTGIFSAKKVQALLIRLFKKVHFGTDVFAAKVIGSAKGAQKKEASIQGYGEGKVTAYMATEMALLLLQQALPHGVLHSHQAVKDIPAFLKRLSKYDSSIVLHL
ncbi:saccharopine dehydrogenase family protein [Taibaiella sp. KBW10]|uniref:saccharopine dehydrogenase family protein n=1 Tax=Taibaiella sp. KBW10 TaxID=2153357 RepID=UPI000F5947BD|nr:saccharopine dehydrogenase NADP-binding domain-containing protein [Taibaiella sp. KBW10]